MKVSLYARYSTSSQDRTSIDGQVVNCEALAAREGFEIVARFHDEARSGNDDRRDAYMALLEALERGDVQGVVCDEELANNWLKLTVRPGRALAWCKINACSGARLAGPALTLQSQGRARPPRSLTKR